MHQLPTACGERSSAEAGCLLSYSNSLAAAYWRVTSYVDKILKCGQNPQERQAGRSPGGAAHALRETACIVPRFDLGVIVAYYQSFSRSRVAWAEERLWPQQCVRGR